MRKTLIMRKTFAWLCAAAALYLSTPMHAVEQSSSVLEAARQGKIDVVRTLLKAGADVNVAKGDGMTALHWAAQDGNVGLAKLLIPAGANLKATTRDGGYTPLLVASKAGHAAMIETLLSSGADPNVVNVNGTTPLMLAAAAGSPDAVKVLITHGADVNATEKIRGQTALMFAATYGRADNVRLLTAHGANPNIIDKAIDMKPFLQEEADLRHKKALFQKAGKVVVYNEERWGPPEVAATKIDPNDGYVDPVPGVGRSYAFTELVGGWGGMAPLHLAARQGELETVKALLEGGANINLSSGNLATALLFATFNGHFDVAKYLLDKGANPNLAQDNGVTPLHAALNVQWSSKAFYPMPRAHEQQHLTYLQLMAAFLEKGADPNARTNKKVWTYGYQSDRSGLEDGGSTPFWRAAYASDIEAMKLLVAHGASPAIPTTRPYGGVSKSGEAGDVQKDTSGLPPVPVGGPGVPPLLATAGLGYAFTPTGNSHRFAPTGMLAAVKYLVEELHADVNATDYEGFTAMHFAASRGDNEMIQYLISKGADPKRVSRYGQTTADMATGLNDRGEPYPETVKLLEGLGVKNNGKCKRC